MRILIVVRVVRVVVRVPIVTRVPVVITVVIIRVPVARSRLRDGFCHSCLSHSRWILLFMNDGGLLISMLLISCWLRIATIIGFRVFIILSIFISVLLSIRLISILTRCQVNAQDNTENCDEAERDWTHYCFFNQLVSATKCNHELFHLLYSENCSMLSREVLLRKFCMKRNAKWKIRVTIAEGKSQ